MTNFNRIQKMNETEMAMFLGGKVDCRYCPKKDLCKNTGLPCQDILFQWLKEDIGTSFEELDYGQKFRIEPKDANIYIKTKEMFDCYGLSWNSINLKTGFPVNFPKDELVLVEKDNQD